MSQADDRLLTPTRWICVAVIPVLLTGFVILWLFPGSTADWFSWTIRPEVTALMVGGSYFVGAVLFASALRNGRWHCVYIGVAATIPITAGLGIETFLHWDVFHHSDAPFWIWLVVYLVLPFVLPVLLVVNGRVDPGPRDGEALLPNPVRTLMTIVGAGLLLGALVAYVSPSALVDAWPWPLTDLTARTILSFATFPAVVLLAAVVEPRWSAFTIPLRVSAAAVAGVVIAIVRRWDDLDDHATGRLVLLLGLLLALAVLVLFDAVMSRGRPVGGGHR